MGQGRTRSLSGGETYSTPDAICDGPKSDVSESDVPKSDVPKERSLSTVRCEERLPEGRSSRNPKGFEEQSLSTVRCELRPEEHDKL
jgi:hypothetical protein